MQKQQYHNIGTTPVYVGGVMIPAGSAREVDARLIPGAVPSAAPAAPVSDPLAELVDGTVKEIEAGLTDLSANDLHRLEALEEAGKNRKGVFEAVEAERLRRAQEGLDADGMDVQGGGANSVDGQGGDGADGE